MTPKLKVMVIGAGYWGKKVIPEYIQIAERDPNIRLEVICDLLDENLSYCEKTYTTPKENLIKDYQDALYSYEIDAVHICTPNETHYQICREALQAGKHVLLEKPMTLISRQAYELVDIATSRGLVLQAGHIFRFNDALNNVRNLLQRNYFGELYYLKLRWTSLMPPPPNRDIIFDLAPHPMDIIHHLLNQWPIRVTSKARAYKRAVLEEVAFIIAELSGGIMAQVELSWLQPGKVREVTIVGSDRCASIDCLNQTIHIHENQNGKVYRLKNERNNTIGAELIHFLNCVLHGDNPVNSGLIGARNVEILEYVRKSLEEERTVEVRM